jgi:hypothetical protein
MPVRGANVKSERLAWLREHGMRYSSLAPEAAPLHEALRRWADARDG